VRDLREQVTSRLRQHHPEGLEAARIKIIAKSWILYQFSPMHPLYDASLHYTSKSNIKNNVQLRTLRAHHTDSHYCATIKKYIMHMGVRAATVIESHTPDDGEHACVSFYSLDDKAKACDPTSETDMDVVNLFYQIMPRWPFITRSTSGSLIFLCLSVVVAGAASSLPTWNPWPAIVIFTL